MCIFRHRNLLCVGLIGSHNLEGEKIIYIILFDSWFENIIFFRPKSEKFAGFGVALAEKNLWKLFME